MDLNLRNGFSEDQLKGLDYDAIVQVYDQSHGKASITDLEIDGPKTPNGNYQNILPIETSKALFKENATDTPCKEGSKSTSTENNAHHLPQPPIKNFEPSAPVPGAGVMPIAIVGMSCRFPGGANDIEKFQELVLKGRSAWSNVPKSRFEVDGFYHPNSDRTDSMNVNAGHFLQGTEYKQFDASFFNISPNEAKAIDPRARMHLEGAYEALENAGITLSEVMGSDTAVFVGAFGADYGNLMAQDPGIVPAYKLTGLGASLFSNRISHWFDLRGPSATVDTACSASMTALHLACECLRKGDSKMAIVSGANLILEPDIMLGLSTLKFLSPDGKTYMFDQRANGYSRGEGVGTLVIKPLSEALRANDAIHAVIRNTRTNQDGRTPGITMPSQDAQRSLIQATYHEAGLDPSETDFFEAHGTGTQVGDRIEAEALSTALSTATRSSQKPLHVGSIKTLLGHTEGCSGVAGVMHAVMALRNKAILPNCNFEVPSDKINFDAWRIKVPTKLESWPADHPRRASVNSFGYGGANVHVVLEEAPDHVGNGFEVDGSAKISNAHLMAGRKILCLSAHDTGGIERQAGLLAEYLQVHSGSELMHDLVYTLGQRRSIQKHRYAVHSDSIQGLKSSLERIKYAPPKASGLKRLAFIFTGQGAQWPKMGFELLAAYPVFKDTFHAANKHMSNLGATWSLLDELYREAAYSKVDEAFISQPLCTAFQVALVDLLRSWAIQPSIVVGHSSGEIAAAYTAGMLSLESAVSVAYYRGKLSSQLVPRDDDPKGAMLATGLSADDVQPYIEGINSGNVTIACINSPKSVTLSGDVGAIDELHSILEEKGLFSRKLKVNVAYHSVHMKAIAGEYSRTLRGLSVLPRNQDVKFFSSVFPGIGVETNTEYWVQNLLSPVRFSDAMKILLESQTEHDLACVEIGPHSALAGPFKQICQSLSAEAKTDYFPSIVRNEDGVEQVLTLACNLFSNGWKIDLASINFPAGGARLRVLTDIPPYAWNHSTDHWHEGRLAQNYCHRKHPPHDLLGTLLDHSSDLDMRWTKYIRHSELPWLKDHVIRSEILLPAGAYLAMAMEAIAQKASIIGLQVQGYKLRDITFSKVLVVPDTSDGIEVSLILEPFRQSSAAISTNWSEFRVISFGPDRKAYEHCHGLISATSKPNFDFSSKDEATLASMRHDKEMKSGLYQQWLSQAASNSNELGSSFQLVSRCCMKGENVFCTLRIPDRFGHESPLTISAPLWDSILQVTVLALAGKARPLAGAMVPTSIAELAISTSISRDPDDLLHARGSTAELSPRDFEGQVILAQDTGDVLEPVVQVQGAKFVVIPRDEEYNKSDDTKAKLCWNVLWEEDPDDLSQEGLAKRWPIPGLAPHEIPQTVMCERASWYCLRSTFESLVDTDIDKMAPHHQNYYNWMKKRYELGQDGNLPYQKKDHQELWSSTDQHVIDSTLQQAAATGAQGRMAVRLGRRLLDVLRGEIDPLSLMLEDDLLNEYYADSRGQDRVYKQAAQFVRLAAHKNPQLRVLEIGAGTGSATTWILKALGGYDNRYPQFSSYVFTDISTGFFEKAQNKFKAWGSLISYKSLNIEEDLKAQGFDDNQGYDIVIAANVLHATHIMHHTMSQVNKLLKPDGKLILVEASAGRMISGELIFGLLPGWWMGITEGRTESPLLSEGQWNSLLKRTGYSGVDICLRDSIEEDSWTMSMMVSSKKSSDGEVGPYEVQITYDDPQERDLVDSLAKEFEKSLSIKTLISALSETDPLKQFIVIVDNAKSSLLLDLDEGKLEVLKSMFSQAKGVLWITFSGSNYSNQAGAGAVLGMLRTLRSESGGMNYVTCDMESDICSNLELAKTISKVFLKAFSKGNMTSSVKELEYAVRDGQIVIPRLVEDKLANKATMLQPLKQELEEQPLWQEDSCLRLEMGHVGLLDTFQFVHSRGLPCDLHDDEVEIEVKTVGLNFHDLMVATGQLPDPNGYGVECAGIVTKLGKKTDQLKVGDRVCAIAPSSFASRVIAFQNLVSIMPDTMSFEVGASIPSVFTTSYYCIHHAARLQRNESILIHSAAGGIGQACIKMAQLVGAEIFVTAGSSAKVDFLQKTFGLPRSHILNSRTLDFGHDIMGLTEGKGVDVIINSLAGDALTESWRCLAMFGRFVELGKKDAVQNSRLDMAPFERSASFIAVGWDHFGNHRPEFVGSVLKEIMSLFANFTLTALEPITTYPMSKIEAAFRSMASGNHIGKIVVTADRDCLVKATPRSPPPLRLRADASYLLVGGLGGIGIEIAKWMVNDLGAKSLILISRSGIDAAGAADAVETLRRPDVAITVRKCDVADREALSTLLQDFAATLPPIRGIVQGAMVLRDAIFPNMTLSKYYQALNPKIRGSQNLHDLFQQSSDQLDFFVMLSSLGGLLGNASQSNYAAGNTFQDALAHHRTAHRLPALTIDVGKVVDAGWVAQNQAVVSRGVLEMARDIRVKDLTNLIEHHIRAGSTGSNKVAAQVAVGIEGYPSFDARFLHVGASLAGFSQKQESQDQTQSLELQMAAAGHDSTRLVSLILEAFKQKLGRLLALKVEDVHEDETIAGHGVDSLVAVEIRNWLRKEAGANVTVFEILNGKVSVRGVVEGIVRDMLKT